MKMKFLVTAAICAFTANAVAADKPAMTAKEQEMMQKWQAAATPGDAHKILADLTGKWKTESKMWHNADAAPEVAKGTSDIKLILGGRWLQQQFKGKAMGKPFEGIGMLGYDNVKGEYQSTWVDSMSTTQMHGTGTYDAATKTLKEKGSMSSPVTATKTEDYRSEWQIVDKNKMIFSMYGSGPTGGAEFKMMEIVYTK